MNTKLTSICAVFVLSLAFTGSAMAQTPDGETPANEDVCDVLIGGTPGLYGLCVGFCEAQDCEATFDPATNEITFDSSCKPSSDKLLTNYNKRAQPGDPPMPCLNVVEAECPCWTEPELDLIADLATFGCGAIFDFDAFLFGLDGATVSAEAAAADADGFGAPSCFYQEQTPLTVRVINVDLDQLLTCIASIEDECAMRGF